MEENELYNVTVPSFSGIEPAFWNYSDHVILDDLKMDSSFIYLLCSLVSAISWIIYIAYYNSRVIGYILTKLLNRFVIRDGYVKVGSFTLSALSGKIMFRDIVYITTDYSIRVQDGWLIFRWWRSYVPKDVSEDLSHSDTRLSVMLNGFELHVYNRCQLYAQLEKTFGLTSQMFVDEENHNINSDDHDIESFSNTTHETRQQINAMDVSRHVDNIRKKEAHVIARTWRDLIPVIKLDVCTGRLVFGNRLIPTTLSITVEEAHFVYSTKPAASRYDHFMHFTKCKAENFKVILAPSPKYTGMSDDPPRYMGEGFVVLSSNNIEVYYYMDEPGFVPEHPQMIQLVNGDMVEAMPPIWGIDIKCGKGTDFSYGPWADRQREHLFKFFFPNDYQPLKVTKTPVTGEKRQVQSFDIRLSTLNEATIDILFSKNRETNAVHINVGPGSYLEITMPWIVLQDGYTTKITGQLLHLEATTSLQYRSLVESETLEFGVKCHYPIKWNDHQEWMLNLTGCKATANLVYSHKEFFQDMINDWASKARPDILHFVPYTWKFNLLLKEFELITLCNEYNWIDCSSQNQENAHIAFCGEFFELSFDLPFVDYLPITIPLRFWIQGESVDLSFYLPEVNTSRTILLALNKNAKIMTRDGSHVYLSELNKNKKWRNVCQKGAGWVDCWSVPIVALSINYTYHPCPPLGPTPQANITTPEKEEILLSPMRIPRCGKSPGLQWTRNGSQKFDPQSIAPDKVSLDLEIGPSILILYGSLLKNFIHLKENLFGDYQTFTDMQQSRTNPTSINTEKSKDRDVQNSSVESVEDEDAKSKPFDPRDYRPLEVTVGITMHDIQAHLVKNCGENDPPCPVILLERFGFEMKKKYKETELQLLLSPAIALITDNFIRSTKERHLNQGHLMLSALQVRGHAMFSNEGRSLDQETLEYAWLIEVQLGKLIGKLSSPQLHHLIISLETFLLMVKNNENSLRPPDLPHHCHHGIPPLQCPDSDIDKHYRCPSSEDIKYRMTRIAIDAIDLYFQEIGTSIHTWISPIRVSTCNLHGQHVKSGVTGVLPRILIRQFVSAADHFANTSNTNTAGSGRSHNNASSRMSGDGSDIWLEVGSITLGPVILEAAISLPTPEHNLHLVQNKYLKLHDETTKRLWFLWPRESGVKATKCGCIGGCAFFGNNRNGPRFFKPSYYDFQDGINIAAYRINESGKEKGFGQSILHNGQLVFHTSPYNLQDVSLQDYPITGVKITATQDGSQTSKKGVERPSGNSIKDVPYSRLVDASPVVQLPQKLDSDSKLHTERSKSILSVPEIETAPKSSVSDSKLAVDYFNASDIEPFESNSPQSLPVVSTEINFTETMQTNIKNVDGVNISDSHHSLYVKSESEEKLKQEVQRTISMSSENHSEAFYSADEDTSHGLSGSRTSSLRQSIVGSGSVLNRNDSIKKKFSSDLSIVESSTNVNISIFEKAHTLERAKPQTMSTKRSPRVNRNTSFQNDTDSNGGNGGLRDSSDSHSVSSTSFISAVSSQEDVTLVNLHMQVNKPIVDSPLLMSSYVSHLSQIRCSNWSQSSIPAGSAAFTTSLFQRTEDNRLVYVGGRYVPKFETVTEGFTSLKMITRSDGSPIANSSNKTPTHPYLWDSTTINHMEGEEDHTAHNKEELLTAQHENGSRTTVIVKFKGDVDIMLTPMVLESLQRFIDAIIPTLSILHPLTILNHLHHECIGKVEDANILKQDQSLSYWSQVQTNSKRSTAERNIKNGQGDDKRKIALQTNMYEESIMTQIQGSIILPKMNITLLQASVVEEIISFSALENIRDLTCVSLFAICFDDVTGRFYVGKQAREVVQTFHKPAVLPNQKKVNKISKAFLPGHQTAAVVADIGSGETVYIETSEKQQEEIVVTLNIGKAHSQLRRLRNESSILKDAVITAIPAHYSRVLFTCTRITSPLKCVDYYLHQFTDDKEKNKQSGSPQATEEFTLGSGEDRLGFIMFECGLEGIKLKIVKRSQFEKGENGNDSKKVDAEIFYTDSVKSQEELDTAAASTTATVEPEITSTNLHNGAQINTSATCASLVSKAGNGNTVSCIIELKTVWFNFAAPPRTPITRKIDYTRLDWNLLSTASPAINAWMNPSNKFAIRIVHMFRTMYRRSTAIVACLMAEALDVQATHMPTKSRYGRLTPLAKTLQEDPSCQLCTILQNYVLLNELKSIEANLKESDLPLLSTLRQGVIVLSRQWKNVLYTPLLLEHNYKTKHVKPLNVTFAVSDPDEENLLTDGEGSTGEVDDQEVTDECAMLIHTDHMHKHTHVKSGQDKSTGYGTLREEKTPQIHISHSHHLGSNPSIYSGGGHGSQHSTGSLDQVTSPTSYHSNKPLNTGEDLYSWMAKQQEFIKENDKGNLKGNWDSKINTMTTDDTEDSDVHSGTLLYPMKDSLRLLDAHLIFEPLLSSLSVMPQQMLSAIGSGNVNNVSSLDSLGSNLSLVGNMETMRIDIVVSEFGKVTDKRKGNKYQTKKGNNTKFYLDIPPETPAFLCEKIGIDIDVKKMADMTVDDMIQKQTVLYISRGQLKKHTSTVVNFSLNIRYISQQVNMPLLRLLHQISNMYQNVKETQMELKEQQPECKRNNTLIVNDTVVKNGSSSTSDLQEQLLLEGKKIDVPLLRNSFEPNLSKVISPGASIRSRPQSFAQKLRSTGKSVKGYINLNEGVITPNFGASPSGSGLDKFCVLPDKCKDTTHLTPRCWKTIYYLLDLYATRPETKTITHRFSIPADASEHYKSGRKYELLNETKDADIEKGLNAENSSTPVPLPRELNIVTGERTRLVIFGVARIHRTRLLATLSGLKLEAEITSLHASFTCRKKSRPASLECSLTGQIGRTMIVLLEGVAPNQQTVVKVTVGKSQALYSSISRRQKDKNSGLLTVGAVNIDIPQHPVALHGMMTRGSKQLSSTLQELRVTRTSSRMSRGQQQDEIDTGVPSSPHHYAPAPSDDLEKPQVVSSLLEPIVMQFHIILQSLSITAALLPSLQAQYKMDRVTSSGITGSKAKFTIDLPHHTLSFTTKLQVTEANLPSEASIELPKVHVSAEYIQDGNSNINDSKLADGVVLRQGSYLSATADIGIFEHSLTTDLLNHLVFVQKVFMKEVNEVVQKVYGGEKPVPLWLEDEEPNNTTVKRILFTLIIRIKRIQLTATTPTNSAVRLETGAVELQLSNRVQNVSGATQPNPYMKLFGKAQVDINLSLGQLLKNLLFEEAEPEFQQFAFFNTRVGLRNAFQEEMAEGEDKEVVLITLKRPLIYVQPMAIDKAILVWLNYKNAYEYWNEKRANLNKEVLTATQQVFEKVPFGQITSQLSAPHLGTLFLQLTVDDMGICLPLNPLPPTWSMNRGLYDGESRGAVVVTLENTSISACSSGSLVSKARFMGLCLRFADDFETSLDDWKPDVTDSSIMNLCMVSEGTYEVCSRTIAQKQDKSDNAKWILNVQWQMEGVDIHLDVNVGQQLSALGHTLTMLTGSEEDDIHVPADYDSDDADQPDNSTSQVKKKESILMKKSKNWTDSLPAFVFDPTLDAKKRSKLIEKEMNEQAKIINDLRSLGASHGTIEQEMKRLHELEAMVFKDFRRDMIQKLRRQSVKASGIKGKLGLGGKPTTYRSRSFIVPSPTLENQLESPEDMNIEVNSANSASYESSPRSGPSRSASLRVRGLSGPRVTFSDTHTMGRQSSLPSAGSELSLPEGELEWPEAIEIDGERVELRKKSRDISYTSSYDSMEGNAPLLDSFGKEQSSSTSSPYITPQKAQEPNIDFELDVKVLINSGKCVLHTKDPGKEDEIKIMSRMKKERSCSGGTFEFQPSSPSSSRKHLSSKEKSSTASTSRLRYLQHTNVPLVDLTIFHIPGLDVKVHYESKTLPEESVSPRVSSDNSLLNPSSVTAFKKSSTKKASLFAWMTLQSIPEETIISPHILEFLEQTLEPIPSKTNFHSNTQTNVVFPLDNAESTSWAATAASSSNYVYASFPVDVIVYFHMQPSTFRFSCLPVSRVECILQLPSLDIIFSSKRAEEELIEFREYKSPSTQSSGKEAGSAIGGLSVTGCLADFSVYIFHPYGGGKKTGLKEAQWSPLSDSERKDSLSINVAFVKFHMSRSRKLNFQSEQLKKISDTSRAVIRFSTIVDIGSASFKYDMRRLSEILAFPKAWYRRSIVRRLFLGDLSSGTAYSEGDGSPSLNQEEAVMGSSLLKHYDRHAADGLSKSAPERSPTLNRDKLRLSLESDIPKHARLKDIGRGWSFTSDKQISSELKLRESAWETLVLFAINFTRLNVHMNMGNVMGNVTWMTKDFRSDGRLSIGSTGHKNLYIGIGLGGSSLDAKGGIVGGVIELSEIDTYIHIREEPGIEPDHTVGLKLFALELRLDYMGTSVLMSRVSSLDVTLRDEWKINRNNSGDAFMPTRRPAVIFMHGDLGWDQLQIMISKSTTADLLKMYYKLDEFFSQQFKSSKRVFSSLQPKHQRVNNSSFRKRTQKKKITNEAPWHTNQTTMSDARHHRHWQGVLAQVAGLQLGSLSFSLPSTGTVLGGTMELHGCNISLACFHGINFKSKNWALFSLKEPCISFTTEAQEIPSVESPNTRDVHVVQTLTISLGQQQEQHARHHSMATVCRLSRSVLFPPQFKSLQEWFHYAFANSEIDAVDRFPCVERERTDSTSDSGNVTRGRSTSTTSGKLQEHSHAREVIFALPSLQLHLKTEHLQTAKTPVVIGAPKHILYSEKPLVECSFITEFEDHIFVTVDAEAFFFLHDLITSYVKEKEKVNMGARAHSPDPQEKKSGSTANTSATTTIISEDEKKRKQFDPAEMFIKDWRSYRCKTWHVEPTVRLLSWAGKSIEPYGIDYILQKLGFAHARTTIPKWIQRGFMDPLDKLLAILMLRMVSAVREESSEEQKEHKREK
ncbi:bridge-like lipid transfer protein family member 1 isoform X15 [Apis cerana]|uniref:bridge-like lipid transfer protein family member 1 isoform X15 n=1 Tax=Apis cerana TaxID=7461 RepID=UPI002B234626|nr:bridge-like lipid transfer protein family member 1 isoform X15 [Apis cerana]